ncbi:hypothetical protein B0H11DRAFT_2013789 [Mycena galericulata]|nr:hypothetical protein B0H11DRAFT_2013789 [Mycena galericulata]
MSEGSPATQIREIVANILKEKPITAAPSPTSTLYQPKDSLQNALRLGGQSAIAGVILAGLRNALSGRNAGFFGPIGIFTAVGATFALTESVVANQRQTNDAINGASGACAAGFLLGLRTRSLPMAVGTCAVMGGMMGMYDYTASPRDGKPAAEKQFFKSTAVVEASKA